MVFTNYISIGLTTNKQMYWSREPTCNVEMPKI